MSVKNDNEITVRVTCSDDELIKTLSDKGFSEDVKFTISDYYMIPKDLKLDELSTRDILSKAVIIRDFDDEGIRSQKITFKKKEINEKGEILSQKATTCDVKDYKAAINLFNELNYYEIMNIEESDIVYQKNKTKLALKFIKGANTLIEIEADEKYDTIEKLKQLVDDLGLPIEKDNYFVKKAEDELNKVLNR